jgi:hypothetical protein
MTSLGFPFPPQAILTFFLESAVKADYPHIPEVHNHNPYSDIFCSLPMIRLYLS